MNTPIYSFPPRLRDLAVTRMFEYAEKYPKRSVSGDDLQQSFSWMETHEGAKFWATIYCGDHQPFYDMYGYDKGFSEVTVEKEVKQKCGETTDRLQKMFVGLSQALNEIAEAKRKAAVSVPRADEFKNGEVVYVKDHANNWVKGIFIGMYEKYFVVNSGKCVNYYNECRKEQLKKAVEEDKNIFKKASLKALNSQNFKDSATLQLLNFKHTHIGDEHIGHAFYAHPGLEVKLATTIGGGTIIRIFKK